MAKRTNKTSHVLNLLTAPSEAGDAEEKEEKTENTEKEDKTEKTEEKREAEPSETRAQSPYVTVIDEADKSERLSGDIKEALMREALDSDTDKAKAEDNSMEIPEEKTRAEEPEEPDYCCINVMEAIMDRYKLNIADYGVCTCKRCQADVRALVLTKLPSKYVITSKNSVAPTLNYYENKYRVDITGAVVLACLKVKDNPRH